MPTIGDAAFSPGDILRRLRRLEGLVRELIAGRRLENASVGAGGITFRGEGGITLTDGGGVVITDNGTLRLVDHDGTAVVDIGPDTTGHPSFRLRRSDGSLMMFTFGSAQFGRDFWSWTDSHGQGIVADDAETGVGMARPWLPVPLYPKWGIAKTGATYDYAGIYTDDLPAGETVMWEGRASIQHPWIEVDGVWGGASGDVNATYRLKINGETVGEWGGDGSFAVYRSGRLDVRKFVLTDWASVQLTVEATGTGLVACQVLGCYLL